MKYRRFNFSKAYLVCLPILILTGSCYKLSEADKQKLYMATLADEQTGGGDSAAASPPDKRLPAEADKSTKGFCGDGIINGDEYCDGTTLSDTNCTDFSGLSGQVRCLQNCKLDIRDCLTQATDKQIGGKSENCKCNCSGSNCDGGCATRGTAINSSRCEYRCEQDCICNCGELLQAHLERCDFECDCVMDGAGNPQCVCAQNQCDILAITKPNIGSLAAQRLSLP